MGKMDKRTASWLALVPRQGTSWCLCHAALAGDRQLWLSLLQKPLIDCIFRAGPGKLAVKIWQGRPMGSQCCSSLWASPWSQHISVHFFHPLWPSLILSSCHAPKSLSMSLASWCHWFLSYALEILSASEVGWEELEMEALVLVSLVVEVLFGIFFVCMVLQTVTSSSLDSEGWWLLARRTHLHHCQFSWIWHHHYQDYDSRVITVLVFILLGLHQQIQPCCHHQSHHPHGM